MLVTSVVFMIICMYLEALKHELALKHEHAQIRNQELSEP